MRPILGEKSILGKRSDAPAHQYGPEHDHVATTATASGARWGVGLAEAAWVW
eukprot:SAG22_NODE_12198_length_453_cov_0.502825_2_plen_51_part_01